MNFVLKNEASQANFNLNKKVLIQQPFLNWVYASFLLGEKVMEDFILQKKISTNITPPPPQPPNKKWAFAHYSQVRPQHC